MRSLTFFHFAKTNSVLEILTFEDTAEGRGKQAGRRRT